MKDAPFALVLLAGIAEHLTASITQVAERNLKKLQLTSVPWDEEQTRPRIKRRVSSSTYDRWWDSAMEGFHQNSKVKKRFLFTVAITFDDTTECMIFVLLSTDRAILRASNSAVFFVKRKVDIAWMSLNSKRVA